MAKTWKNWSKNIKFKPKTIRYPKSELEIVQLVKLALSEHKTIRVVGAGHSFVPVVETEYLISLDKYQGIISIDNHLVTVKSGTRLKLLGELLHKQGIAMKNLGDIDKQSIAGAISTGTHGTGITLGTIATQVVKIKIVNGKAEILTISKNIDQDLFNSILISLGLLGIIIEITIETVPSYVLDYKSGKTTFDEVFNNLEDLKKMNRNFEFYWFPHSNYIQTKVSNEIEISKIKRKRFSSYFNDIIMENHVFGFTCFISKLFPRSAKYFSKLAGWTISGFEKTDYSHKIYTTVRKVKFLEMEYSIQEESCEKVLTEIKTYIERENVRVNFPIEIRFVEKDDIFLSPAFESNRCYIAIHMYKGMKFKKFFEDCEEIFLKYDGRPHWGKIHFLGYEKINRKYPKLAIFLDKRSEMDPNGIFLNEYFRKLFNI